MQNSTKAWWLASLTGLAGCLANGEEMGGSSADEGVGAFTSELSENVVRTRVVGSNTESSDNLGFWSLALSDDGLTMVVGATEEDSRSASEPEDNSLTNSGAAYVFARPSRDADWVQQGYLKASNPDEYNGFGEDVAISGDGKYVAVGCMDEESDGSSQSDNSMPGAGAVYVYRYDDVVGSWVQDAYIKASSPQPGDYFGASVSLSTDGSTLAVGAFLAGDDIGPIGAQPYPGHAYVFRRDPAGWTEQALLKASNADDNDAFGWRVALDGSGNLLAVSATREASGAVGVDGNQDENVIGEFGSPIHAGAVYVFKFENGAWAQQSYIKASNTDTIDEGDYFGHSLALSSDGSTLAVGTENEDSDARTINGDQTNNAAPESGAVYVFRATANGSWSQEAYVKPNNTDPFDGFGWAIALSNNGDHLVVAATNEASTATEPVGGDPFNNDGRMPGAAYVFERTGTEWAQQAYLKPGRSKIKRAGPPENFGRSLDVNGTGDVIAVGTREVARDKAGVFTFTDL